MVPFGAALLLFAASAMCAQSNEQWRLGGFAHWGGLDYTADMGALPGVPSCCPSYTDGGGNMFSFGLSWGLPLFSSFAWEGRLSFSRYSGALEAEELELVTAGRDTATAAFGHTIEAVQPALGIDALLSFSLLPHLKILGGIKGEWMPGGRFHQEETILSPDNIRFENDRRYRMVYDGPLPDELPFHLSLIGGLRYEIALNEKGSVLLAPEVFFRQDFIDIIEHERWRMRGFQAGLTLQFLYEKVRPSPLDPLPARPEEPLIQEPVEGRGAE